MTRVLGVACLRLSQEREINALKAEINLLRMKGGHVYTPSPQEAQGLGGDPGGSMEGEM